MEAYIKAISYYLPQKVRTNEELVSMFPEWTVKKITKKVGIEERHVSGDSECASDMAVAAAEKMFTEHGIDRNDIDFVLLCTQSPDYFLPSSSCVIQERLGLKTSCGAFDYNLGCSGFVYGLAVAKGLIAAGIARNVLLLTSETYTKHLHERDKGNMTIFGDAAAATLVSTDGFASIEEFSLGTDGKGRENLIVRTGGMRCPSKAGDTSYDENGNPKSSDHLFMNGSEIFNFTAEIVPPLVDDVLSKNKLLKENVNLFVFHQANKYILDFLKDMVGVEDDRFYYYVSKVGNTVSSTLPIALWNACGENRAIGNVLIAGFGVGYSWGGCILNFK
ncbi:MAG: ketoacyl-ACP synthase III [Bacteroidia bacterium]|nr:ketoacyl-ACP synthase III [Bacteroidia bacterium]